MNIEIADDGAGIDVQVLKNKAVQKGLIRIEQAERMSDREALALIFLPGFSTAAEVTSVSGRGVGMDVVKTNIEKIGGVVELVSRLGEGTTLKLKIPLTLAIIPGLVVTLKERRSAPRELEGAGERYVIPQVSLLELIRLEGDAGKRQIERIHDTPFYRRRGSLLPLVYLADVLQLGGARRIQCGQYRGPAGRRPPVWPGRGWHQRHPGNRGEAARQAIEGLELLCRRHHHGRWPCGLDPGRVGHRAVVRRGAGIPRQVQRGDPAPRPFRQRAPDVPAVPGGIVRTPGGPAFAGSAAGGNRTLQNRARRRQTASCNTAGGFCRWPRWRRSWIPARRIPPVSRIPAQVVVFNNGERSMGILVDQILDIVEDQVTVRQAAARQGLLGSAVVGKKVTDLLDLHAVIQAADEQLVRQPGCAARQRRHGHGRGGFSFRARPGAQLARNGRLSRGGDGRHTRRPCANWSAAKSMWCWPVSICRRMAATV